MSYKMLNSEKYNTILISEAEYGIRITINRPEHRNSLNLTLIRELDKLLDIAEHNPKVKLIVIEGQNGFFCTGMDFDTTISSTNEDEVQTSAYMNLIRRFTLIPKIIISVTDGQVIGGGVGIAAASDFVIATPRSQFALSEALWGLLPAMVIPYLMRRVGFRKAYQMTLTTLPISAEEACKIYLADEVSENPENNIRRLWSRLKRLDEVTIGNIKQYFRKMWMINEQIEETAVFEISRLMAEPKVRKNIENFVKFKKFPWESSDGK